MKTKKVGVTGTGLLILPDFAKCHSGDYVRQYLVDIVTRQAKFLEKVFSKTATQMK